MGALNILQSNHIDLVMLDILMPGISALEVNFDEFEIEEVY